MKRCFGTVACGLRSPIIKQGDDLLKIIPDLLQEAEDLGQLRIRDRDIICITESILGRAQGNYASVADIAEDVKKKLDPKCKQLGLVFPILSRNRFAILLKAIATAVDELVILLSYPRDEVGNPLFDPRKLAKRAVNPWQDTLDEQSFRQQFGPCNHPFTGVDYVDLYREICEEAGAKVTFIFSNQAEAILAYTDVVLACDIHSLATTRERLKKAGAKQVLGLDDILNEISDQHGYNVTYGLLGSNKADEQRVKLFPRNCQLFVDSLADRLQQMSGKKVEAMIYGDGAFRDPVGKIWELADPVVSPGFTEGLNGRPNEVKLKYLADGAFNNLNPQEQAEKIQDIIRHKEDTPVDSMATQGTTPRQYTDLIGSLADLVSGSGDKGTPFVYIQGYFDNYSDN